MNWVAGMLSLVRRTKVGAIVSQLAVADTNDLKISSTAQGRFARPGFVERNQAAERGHPQLHVVADAKMRPPK
jgi:hypothetical protein